jgi:hypothetical protein
VPFREKTAWLSLIAMVVTFGPYFALVGLFAQGDALPNLRLLGLFAIAAIAQAIILGAGRFFLSRSAPEDARVPPDERDLGIMRRSISSAYYVLIGGMIVVGCVMPFNSGGWSIINAALLMIVAAEIVHYGVAIASYRRQA